MTDFFSALGPTNAEDGHARSTHRIALHRNLFVWPACGTSARTDCAGERSYEWSVYKPDATESRGTGHRLFEGGHQASRSLDWTPVPHPLSLSPASVLRCR